MPSSARGFAWIHITWLLTSGVSLVSVTGYAAAPTLEYVFPLAWQRGANVALTLGGKFDPWPVKVWTDCSGLEFIAETNSGKVSAQIAKDAHLGPHLMRVFNQDGASSPRLFIIGQQMDQEETEPNDSFKQAKTIEKLPVTVTGKLEKGGDVDSFAVRVDAGKWVVARVDAYSLGSPLDATLQLVNEQGIRVAFNHDSQRNIDPLLAYRVEKPGIYVLQVAGFAHPPEANVRYAGSAASIYRLTVTDGPLAHHVFPVGVQRGHKAQLQLHGWNLGQAGLALEQTFDGSGLAADVEEAFINVPGVEDPLGILISDAPEQTESEPNNKTNQSQLVSLPGAISGRIDPPGDEDRFTFTAKKGDRFEFRTASAALDLPLDAVVKIEDAAGKVLGEDDDGGDRPDAKLVWVAPSDGSYIAAVSDRFGRGGNDFIYRLAIAPPTPDFKVVVPDNIVSLEPGKTNEIKLTVTRFDGYTNTLRVTVEGLPAGVTVQAGEVPPQNGEVKVTFLAALDAQPVNQPLQIYVRATDDGMSKSRPASFDLRGKDPRGDALINQTDQLWLTVIPKPEPPPAKPEEKKR